MNNDHLTPEMQALIAEWERSNPGQRFPTQGAELNLLMEGAGIKSPVKPVSDKERGLFQAMIGHQLSNTDNARADGDEAFNPLRGIGGGDSLPNLEKQLAEQKNLRYQAGGYVEDPKMRQFHVPKSVRDKFSQYDAPIKSLEDRINLESQTPSGATVLYDRNSESMKDLSWYDRPGRRWLAETQLPGLRKSKNVRDEMASLKQRRDHLRQIIESGDGGFAPVDVPSNVEDVQSESPRLLASGPDTGDYRDSITQGMFSAPRLLPVPVGKPDVGDVAQNDVVTEPEKRIPLSRRLLSTVDISDPESRSDRTSRRQHLTGIKKAEPRVTSTDISKMDRQWSDLRDLKKNPMTADEQKYADGEESPVKPSLAERMSALRNKSKNVSVNATERNLIKEMFGYSDDPSARKRQMLDAIRGGTSSSAEKSVLKPSTLDDGMSDESYGKYRDGAIVGNSRVTIGPDGKIAMKGLVSEEESSQRKQSALAAARASEQRRAQKSSESRRGLVAALAGTPAPAGSSPEFMKAYSLNQKTSNQDVDDTSWTPREIAYLNQGMRGQSPADAAAWASHVRSLKEQQINSVNAKRDREYQAKNSAADRALRAKQHEDTNELGRGELAYKKEHSANELGLREKQHAETTGLGREELEYKKEHSKSDLDFRKKQHEDSTDLGKGELADKRSHYKSLADESSEDRKLKKSESMNTRRQQISKQLSDLNEQAMSYEIVILSKDKKDTPEKKAVAKTYLDDVNRLKRELLSELESLSPQTASGASANRTLAEAINGGNNVSVSATPPAF